MDESQLPRFGVATVAGVPVVRDRQEKKWAQPNFTWMQEDQVPRLMGGWVTALSDPSPGGESTSSMLSLRWHPDAELSEKLNRRNYYDPLATRTPAAPLPTWERRLNRNRLDQFLDEELDDLLNDF